MNMGTIGGNVCNAAPSADTAPALLAYEAQAIIVGRDGRRSMPIGEFFRGPGITALEPGELLAEIRLPARPPNTGGTYRRHTPRKQMDIAVVGGSRHHRRLRNDLTRRNRPGRAAQHRSGTSEAEQRWRRASR
jgi:CO/xanthine dehydrogenase FAD-binding subunit